MEHYTVLESRSHHVSSAQFTLTQPHLPASLLVTTSVCINIQEMPRNETNIFQ